ncbi:virion morphogenesis protein [Roseobacter sp. YSTF-M11]|uniref:Virion morphogenesis protein n=1 Tax=Roseobacter insulae TaxID=2859783 RepID=A0A9X1JYX5_9RHOB|nr:phage minor head protein [Roseobacter insulae]MBW4708630.1 virion morphogenesis protein [Roseobacter insulae]
MAEPISAVFRQPFKEQVAAFRLRLGDLVPTSRWDDISRAQHDRAFMVAGATKADLLADLGAAVDKAISEGTSLEEFRRDFRQIVETRGWHGWTGEGTARGEAWRTKVIYRTNLATTRAAGRYAQHFSGAFRYLVYRHSGAENYRPEHLGWDGLILPVDHPFWKTHYPINGWGCACFVRGARTLAGAIRVGGKPDVTLPPDWATRDPRTGAPVGIDKGWDYAPGATVDDTIRALKPKVDQLPSRPAIDLIQDWLQGRAFESWFANPVGKWPVARIARADAEALKVRTRTAVLSPDTVAKQLRNHPDLTVADYKLIQRAVDKATRKLSQGSNRRVFIHEDPEGGGQILVVKAVVEQDELFVLSYLKLSRKDRDRDRKVRQFINKSE